LRSWIEQLNQFDVENAVYWPMVSYYNEVVEDKEAARWRF
jgi:hypothetical protein